MRGSRPDRYGEGGGVCDYPGDTSDHWNSEAAAYTKFAKAIGLRLDDDDAPATAITPLWVCVSCGFSPADDGRVVGGPAPKVCPKCGCIHFEPVNPMIERDRTRPPGESAYKQRLSDDQKHHIIRLARNTRLSDTDIGAKVGCSETTARKVRTAAGISTARRRRKGKATRKESRP